MKLGSSGWSSSSCSSGGAAAEAISDGVCSLLPLAASLLGSTRLPDEVVLRLTQACLATFSVSSNKDSILLLQLKAMAVLSTVSALHGPGTVGKPASCIRSHLHE